MFAVITLPFDRDKKGFDAELLNRFFLNKHVNSYHPEFFEDGGEKFWTVFVEYDPLVEKNTGNEAEGLDTGERMLFERLKAWRKERAEKDGVPVYIIGTNKDLVNIVKASPKSIEGLKSIRGFGKGKIERYGKEITEMVRGFHEKK